MQGKKGETLAGGGRAEGGAFWQQEPRITAVAAPLAQGHHQSATCALCNRAMPNGAKPDVQGGVGLKLGGGRGKPGERGEEIPCRTASQSGQCEDRNDPHALNSGVAYQRNAPAFGA